MAKATPDPKAKLVAGLEQQVKKLQAQLAEIPFRVRIKTTEAHYYRLRDPNGPNDLGLGKYVLVVDIIVGKETVFIPISIASGRKSAGFIYQVEGNATGSSVATISVKGDGVATVTAGTIAYAKVAAGKTATFKILSEITGKEGKTYKLVVSRINYKLNPNDLRYRRFLTEISTKSLKFK